MIVSRRSSAAKRNIPAWARPVFWFVKAAGYLLTMLLVALLGALLLGNYEHDIRSWGWIAGAIIAAVGYPLGIVKIGGGGWVKLNAEKTAATEESAVPEVNDGQRQMNIMLRLLVGALAGVIVGALLATFLLFAWVSVALSPMTPDNWRSDIVTGFFSFSFRSAAIPLWLFGGGVVLSTLVGSIFGMTTPVSFTATFRGGTR